MPDESTSVLRQECGAYVRRPRGRLARPTREGYRVVCRPRRTSPGAAWAVHIAGRFLARALTVNARRIDGSRRALVLAERGDF